MQLTFASIGNHKAECLSLDHDVQEKILGLKREFTDISCQARQWLESRYPEAKGAAWWLNETLRGRKDEPLVVEGSVSDYGELGDQLQKKWSFTNPDFLEQLIGETDITLIQQMSEYRKKFDCFCCSFPISNQTIDKEVRFEDYDPYQPCLVLMIESDMDTNFHGVRVFLEDVFDIYKRYLRVHKIASGKIKKVTLQYQPNMEPQIQERIKHNKDNKYADMHIMEAQTDQTGTPETQQTGSHATHLKKEQAEKTRTHSTLENCTRKVVLHLPNNTCIVPREEKKPYQISKQPSKLTAKRRSYSYPESRQFKMGNMYKTHERTRLRKRARTTDATEKDLKQKKVKELHIEECVIIIP